MSPDGPSVNATKQGDAGDCYFLASLAAMAHQRPDSTRSMFHVLDDDTVAVGLH